MAGTIYTDIISTKALQTNHAGKVEKLKIIGWASHIEKDDVNEIVPNTTIENAIEDYAEWGNIREMHNAELGGKGVCDILIVENEGLWIEATIVDDDCIKKILNGVYKGLSIGYITLEEHLTVKGNILDKILLIEISVVDRPANQKAKFTALENHYKALSIEEIKVKQGDEMPIKKLTLEQKSNMPDESFAFVGMLNEKYCRIMAYKDATGAIDPDLALSSINILNSDREEDVKHLSSEDKKSCYDAIVEGLKSIRFDGEIPALNLSDEDDPDTEGKTIEGEAGKSSAEEPEKENTDFQTVLESQDKKFGEITKSIEDVREEQAKGFSKFAKKFAEFFKKKEEPAKEEEGKSVERDEKKAIEVQSAPTEFDDVDTLQTVKWQLFDVPYILRETLDNILFSDELSAEDKIAKAVTAFNTAKEKWVSLFREVAEISEFSKSIDPESKEVESVKAEEKPTEKEPEKKSNEPTEKETTLLLEKKDLEKKYNELVAAHEKLGGEVPLPGQKAIEAEGKKLDKDDPNFWI